MFLDSVLKATLFSIIIVMVLSTSWLGIPYIYADNFQIYILYLDFPMNDKPIFSITLASPLSDLIYTSYLKHIQNYSMIFP